jgi:hypothetical protein
MSGVPKNYAKAQANAASDPAGVAIDSFRDQMLSIKKAASDARANELHSPAARDAHAAARAAGAAADKATRSHEIALHHVRANRGNYAISAAAAAARDAVDARTAANDAAVAAAKDPSNNTAKKYAEAAAEAAETAEAAAAAAKDSTKALEKTVANNATLTEDEQRARLEENAKRKPGNLNKLFGKELVKEKALGREQRPKNPGPAFTPKVGVEKYTDELILRSATQAGILMSGKIENKFADINKKIMVSPGKYEYKAKSIDEMRSLFSTDYKTILENQEISEEQAILVYDEILLLLLILCKELAMSSGSTSSEIVGYSIKQICDYMKNYTITKTKGFLPYTTQNVILNKANIKKIKEKYNSNGFNTILRNINDVYTVFIDEGKEPFKRPFTASGLRDKLKYWGLVNDQGCFLYNKVKGFGKGDITEDEVGEFFDINVKAGSKARLAPNAGLDELSNAKITYAPLVPPKGGRRTRKNKSKRRSNTRRH